MDPQNPILIIKAPILVSPVRFQPPCRLHQLLGGSWIIISGVKSPLIRVINIVTLLITPLIITDEPPSRLYYKALFG